MNSATGASGYHRTGYFETTAFLELFYQIRNQPSSDLAAENPWDALGYELQVDYEDDNFVPLTQLRKRLKPLPGTDVPTPSGRDDHNILGWLGRYEATLSGLFCLGSAGTAQDAHHEGQWGSGRQPLRSVQPV